MSQQELVLITGAGSGIGREFTRIFLAEGSKVLAVSLLQDELDKLKAEFDPKGNNLTILAMDLGKPDSAEELFNYCNNESLVIDVLVNNAGFACYGDAVDENLDKLSSMIALNVNTLTKTSILFGKQMQERKAGDIMNVGSTVGMAPSARFAAYSGSKAYVNIFTFCLRAELAPYNVNVTCITPCAVATNFAKAANIDTFSGKSMLKDLFSKNKASKPEDIAADAYKGLRNKKAHVLTGKGKLSVALMHALIPLSKIPSLLKNL